MVKSVNTEVCKTSMRRCNSGSDLKDTGRESRPHIALRTRQIVNLLAIDFTDVDLEVNGRDVAQNGLFFEVVVEIGAQALKRRKGFLLVRFGKYRDEHSDILKIGGDGCAGYGDEHAAGAHIKCKKGAGVVRDLFGNFVLTT